MDEEKNIMKYVILFFDNNNISVHVYMSLETLNKIKKAYQFYILVDEQNGF